MLSMLKQWQQCGALRAIDLALTRQIALLANEQQPAVLLAVALTSERSGHSHVCLDLVQALHPSPHRLLTLAAQTDELIGRIAIEPLRQQLAALRLDEWLAQLRQSVAVADHIADPPTAAAAPLILAGSEARPLLYLRRYWQCEQQIQQQIARRLQQPPTLPEPATLRPLLDALFPPPAAPYRIEGERQPDWQKLACAVAARSRFAIITGGPGTGKTTTVMGLLALLQGIQKLRDEAPLRIRLATPTGKAAARLNESIRGRMHEMAGLPAANLSAEMLTAQIPTQVETLHRLLGAAGESRHFHYHAGQPLAVDLVVVDEASMVDVELMAALLEALPPTARLVLLGDKDQLASVEAGYVLGDLCRDAEAGRYTAATRDWLQQASGEALPDRLIDAGGGVLSQAVAMLRYSHRFPPGGVIDQLATLVNGRALPTAAAATDYPRWEALRRLAHAAQQLEARQAVHQADESRGQQLELGFTDTPPASPRSTKKSAKSKGIGESLLVLLHQSQGDRGDEPWDEHVQNLLVNGYKPYLEQIKKQPQECGEAADEWAKKLLEKQRMFQLLVALRRGPWGGIALNRRIEQLLQDKRAISRSDQTPWYIGRPVMVTRNDYRLGLMNGDIGICVADHEGGRGHYRVVFKDPTGAIRWIAPSRLQGVETVFAMSVHKSQGSEFRHVALLLPDHKTPLLTRELIYTGITRASHQVTLIYGDHITVVEEGLARRVERASGLLSIDWSSEIGAGLRYE